MTRPSVVKVMPFIYLFVFVITYIVLLFQHAKEESEPRVFPKILNENLVEYYTYAFVFLAIPVLGFMASVRLARLKESRLQPIGIALAALFVLWFVMSCQVYWHEFEKYVR